MYPLGSMNSYFRAMDVFFASKDFCDRQYNAAKLKHAGYSKKNYNMNISQPDNKSYSMRCRLTMPLSRRNP